MQGSTACFIQTRADIIYGIMVSRQGTLGMLFLAVPTPAVGYLLPGQWAYYQLTLDPSDASWMVRRDQGSMSLLQPKAVLLVQGLCKSALHPVLPCSA